MCLGAELISGGPGENPCLWRRLSALELGTLESPTEEPA